MSDLSTHLKARLEFEETEYEEIAMLYSANDPEYIFLSGAHSENERLKPIHEALIKVIEALYDGKPSYNSPWSMICLMSEGEGSNGEVYQAMANGVYEKLKPVLDALAAVIEGEKERWA